MNKTIRTGDRFSRTFPVSAETIEGFAKYSSDRNPVHLDEKYAASTIFGKRIAHGFLVGSFISAVLGNDFPGNGTIYLSQTLKFRAPVFIGDQITVEVEVTDIPKDNRLMMQTTCMNQEGRVVVDGEALIIPPAGFNLIKN
jgi:3-hydroxybutyryl-CoA dehydratase